MTYNPFSVPWLSPREPESSVLSGSREQLNLPRRAFNPSSFMWILLLIIDIEGYIVLVPFVEDEEKIFLKTAFKSRKATKQYIGGNPDAKKTKS